MCQDFSWVSVSNKPSSFDSLVSEDTQLKAYSFLWESQKEGRQCGVSFLLTAVSNLRNPNLQS